MSWKYFPQWWGERCGNAFILHRGKLFPEMSADKPPCPELRFETWWLFYAVGIRNTLFHYLSPKDVQAALIQQAFAFNENCGLAVRPDFGSAAQGGCVDQRKGTEICTGICKDMISPGSSSRTLLWFLLGTASSPVQVSTCVPSNTDPQVLFLSRPRSRGSVLWPQCSITHHTRSVMYN